MIFFCYSHSNQKLYLPSFLDKLSLLNPLNKLYLDLFYPFLYAFVRLRRIYKIRGSRRFMHIYVGSDINKYMFNIFVSSFIVVSGLIIALLEPRHIYGGMSGSWIWWVSLSVLVYNYNAFLSKMKM